MHLHPYQKANIYLRACSDHDMLVCVSYLCVIPIRALTPSTRHVWWRSWRIQRATGGGAGTAWPALSMRAALRPARKWVWAWSGTGWVQIHYSQVTWPVTSLEEQGLVSKVTESPDWYRTAYKWTDSKEKTITCCVIWKGEMRGSRHLKLAGIWLLWLLFLSYLSQSGSLAKWSTSQEAQEGPLSTVVRLHKNTNLSFPRDIFNDVTEYEWFWKQVEVSQPAFSQNEAHLVSKTTHTHTNE